MNTICIKASVIFEDKFWSVFFERTDDKSLSVAKAIFGKEPTDVEVYAYIHDNFSKFQFSQPVAFKLIIKRKNPKRVLREIKEEMGKMQNNKKETHAQEVMRQQMEINKVAKKKQRKEIEEKRKDEIYSKRVMKKKEKKRGH